MSGRTRSIRVIDPRIAREGEVVDVIPEGPASTTYRSVTTPDPTSLSPSFVVQPGSVNTGISRTMRHRLVGTLTVTGTGLDAWTAINRVALRQFALASICQNQQVQINDTTLSLGSVQLYVPALAAVANTSGSMSSTGSTYASIPDRFTSYDMDALRSGGLFSMMGEGPFSDDATAGRTAQITSFAVNGAFTVATIGFDISECLMLSPFNYSEREQKALFGVQTLTYSCSYSSPHRMLSWASNAGAATVTSVTMAPSQQLLEVAFIAPDDSSLIERPIKHIYDFAQIAYYSTAGSNVAAGLTVPISSNAIEFATVPSKFVVMCTYSATDIQNPALSLCDVCLPLVSCSAQFGIRSGIFAGASSVNLWEVSRRGGSRDKYPLWAGLPAITSGSTASAVYSGRPFIIDVASDMNLPAGENPVVPGMQQRVQLVFQATFKNNTAATIVSPRLVILAVIPGTLSSKDGSTVQQLGGVTTEAARSAPVAPLLKADVLGHLGRTEGISGGGRMTGGGFFDDIWDGVKSGLKGATDVAVQLAPLALKLAGGSLLGGASIGGASIGGRGRNKSQLLGGRAMAADQY